MIDVIQIVQAGGLTLFAFTLALIGLGTTLFFFRSGLLFIAQAIIVVAFVFFANLFVIALVIGIVELLFIIYLFYRIYLAIDYNYRLVLEKTNQRRPEITKTSYTGGRSTF